LIPVLEKYPSKVDEPLLTYITGQIPTHAMKALRLLSIVIDSMTDQTLNLEVCDTLTRWADIFISHGAGRTLMNTLQKTMRRLPSFCAVRRDVCIGVFIRALSAQSPGTVLTAVVHLIAQSPASLAAPPDVVLGVLAHEQLRDKMLRLLCIVPLETVSADLLVWLLTEGRTPGAWANAALVAVCRVKPAADLLLKHPELWLLREGLPVRVQLQVMLALATNVATRAALIALPAFVEFCANRAAAADTVVIEVIGPLLKKCRVDAAFLTRIVESGCVRAIAGLVESPLTDRTFERVYAFAEALASAGWADDFATFIRAAGTHVQGPAPLAAAAAAFLTAVSLLPSGVAFVKQTGIVSFLSQRRATLPPEVGVYAGRILSAAGAS
jgi:hypothetical protein